MGEYGRVVGETSGGAGGGGGGSGDLGGNVMDAIAGAFDQVASLPAEVLLVGIGVALVVGLIVTLR